jgi:two-component system C4-dicarboxylate transport sensor histidine kinase DctB
VREGADNISAFTMPARRPLRQLILLLLWLALSGLSGWGAYLLAQRLGIADLRATGMHRLELYGASLQREIGKYAFLPDVLALEGNVQGCWPSPATSSSPTASMPTWSSSTTARAR